MSEYAMTTNGDRVAYDRRGAGPGAVFIAGAGPFRAVDPWTSETAELAAGLGVTTIVHDRLGRGESPAEGRIDLERELAAVAALIEAAGGSAVLVGHSSGGSIALAAAASGLAVDGLVLWEPPIGVIRGGARDWSAEVERRIEAGDLDGALAHYMKDMPPEWLEGARQSPTYPEMVARVPSYRADGQSLAWAESAPPAELFRDLRVPVEVLLGAETFPEMFGAAELIAGAIPGATWRQVPGANHTWEPSAFAPKLAEFVLAARRERETAGSGSSRAAKLSSSS